MKRLVVGGVKDDEHLSELKQKVLDGLPESVLDELMGDGEPGDARVLFCFDDGRLSAWDIELLHGKHGTLEVSGLLFNHEEGNRYDVFRRIGVIDDSHRLTNALHIQGLIQEAKGYEFTKERDMDCLYARQYEVDPNATALWTSKEMQQHQAEHQRELTCEALEEHYTKARERLLKLEEDMLFQLFETRGLSQRVKAEQHDLAGGSEVDKRMYNRHVDRITGFMDDFPAERLHHVRNWVDDLDALIVEVEGTIDADIRPPRSTPEQFARIELLVGENPPPVFVNKARFERFLTYDLPKYVVPRGSEKETISFEMFRGDRVADGENSPPDVFLKRVRDAMGYAQMNEREARESGVIGALDRLEIGLHRDSVGELTPYIKHTPYREREIQQSEKAKGIER